MKFKVLITNDDGIYAPGIRELVATVSSFADVWVVAPENEQSGKSLSITTQKTLILREVNLFTQSNTKEISAWSVSGTPADCTKVAISVLNFTPDIIISGINKGSNAGRNVLYSGTVGGVIEGVLRGFPGIAFSCCDIQHPEYHRLTPFIQPMVEYILDKPLPAGTLLNVNFPHTHEDSPWPKIQEIQGVKLASQGRGYWIEDLKSPLAIRKHSQQEKHIDFGAQPALYEENTNTDMYWLERGYIAAVPIHVDELTDWRYFNKHQESFESITTCQISS